MTQLFTVKAKIMNGLHIKTRLYMTGSVDIDITPANGAIITFTDQSTAQPDTPAIERRFAVGETGDIKGAIRAKELIIENSMGQTTERIVSNIPHGLEPDQAGKH